MSATSFEQHDVTGEIRVNEFPDEEFMEEGSWSSAREVPAWVISLAVHVAVLIIFASITTATGLLDQQMEITSEIEDLEDELEYKFDATVQDQIGNNSDANKLSASQLAATNAGKTPEKQMQQQLEEELLTVEVPVTEPIQQPHEAELLEQVNVKGQALDHPGGIEGAVDRMTWEIASSLKEKQTLLVWLFDESISVQQRREAIAERFDNIYKQLGLLNVETGEALKTAVVGFADKTNIYTPEPISDTQKLVEIVKQIKAPPSGMGIENVFTAVDQVAKKWLAYRTRQKHNFMIVIVTDERGDDYEHVEDVAAFCARYGIKVYCIGNAAPFGRETGLLIIPSFTNQDGVVEENAEFDLEQGPETVQPERLQLGFWGTQSGGLNGMTASYGPYALTRLCSETKGMFLVAQESQRGPTIDPAIMRDYSPDYRPIREYIADKERNMAKMALVEASSIPARDVPLPALRFRADTDNQLRTEVTDAQKPAAEFDYKLQQILTVLENGEKDRKKIREPRWQASYDLAMGRVAAMRVRAYGYNVLLAAMKSSPKVFEDKQNNTWQLAPGRDIQGGPTVRKLATKATEYLTRVIDEHPGTPWAYIAERELGSPMGWEWIEQQQNYSENGRLVTVNGKQILLADDEEIDPKTGQKKKRKPRPPRRKG